MTLAGTLTDLNTFIANGNLDFHHRAERHGQRQPHGDAERQRPYRHGSGLTGNGTSEEDTDIVTLTVTAVNDAPVNDTSNILDIVTANGGSNNVSVLHRRRRWDVRHRFAIRCRQRSGVRRAWRYQ